VPARQVEHPLRATGGDQPGDVVAGEAGEVEEAAHVALPVGVVRIARVQARGLAGLDRVVDVRELVPHVLVEGLDVGPHALRTVAEHVFLDRGRVAVPAVSILDVAERMQRHQQDVGAALVELQAAGEALRGVLPLSERVEDAERGPGHDRPGHRHGLERLQQRRRDDSRRECEAVGDVVGAGGDPHRSSVRSGRPAKRAFSHDFP
jgi:hypothetical protein